MISALTMYGAGLRGGAESRSRQHARLVDGTIVPFPLERYLGPADATDEQVLDGLRGPVLDVGCGPGRHLHTLAARGIFALGVDLSPVAVELAIGGGGRAIVGDIFDELPRSGSWRSALLLDGNIGIGGSPVRLLGRIAGLLAADGELLVELGSPDEVTCSTLARLEADGVASAWFPWARVAVAEIGPIARAGGFRDVETWARAGRWFARLHRDDRHSGPRHPRRHPARRLGRAGSVP